MQKIKVLEMVDSIQYGGVEQFLYNYLTNIDLKKYNITIITTGKRYPEAEERFLKLGVRICGVPLKKENFIKYLSEINTIIKNGKFDVIHSHLNYWSSIPLIFANKYKIKTKIAHAHVNVKKNILTSMLSKITLLNSDINLACSETASVSVFGNNKFEIIGNGIDVDKFKYNDKIRHEIRNKYNVDNNCFLIGHVGRFYSIKNHSFIIKTFFEYQKKYNNSKLMLVGDGDLIDDCKKLVKELNIEDKVIFTGNVSNVYDYFQAFDIFVLPSIREGFGMVAIEAQCSGLNCIVSNGVPKEVNITNNVKYLDIKESSKWVELIKEMNFNNNRLEGYNVIKLSKYNILNNVKKLEDLYQNNDIK